MRRYIPNYKVQLVEESNYIADRKIIHSPKDCFEIMKDLYKTCVTEQFHIILLNTKNHVLGISRISTGTLNASLVHPREVFQPVLLQGMVASIILSHNHPSGDATPSPEDITLTMKLINAGKLLDIPIIDHIIVGDDTYVSFKDKGII
ncbi:JAB domain-containing protein [Anaerospora sp.]|uniref:JAB domain-containing protein n=1 Tax=Anaerospora sp. TaxID=1960278 RepID=UPI0028A19496|nr:JAB domain-containing protein [Anaerospora sp.]